MTTAAKATFPTPSAALNHAKPKAAHGRRAWLVYCIAFDAWVAEPLSALAVESACATRFKFYSVEANTGLVTNVGPNLARVMLSNARNGHL